MAVTNIPISKQGYKRLEEELARLKSERPAIIQAIKEAREEGDLRENAGYDAARERQGMAEARIKYIEYCMALYQVVDLDKLSGDKVIFGSTVEVEDVDTEESRTYTILGPDEAEPAKGSISFLSPVGQALLGKEVGDEVSVDIPRGHHLPRLQHLRLTVGTGTPSSPAASLHRAFFRLLPRGRPSSHRELGSSGPACYPRPDPFCRLKVPRMPNMLPRLLYILAALAWFLLLRPNPVTIVMAGCFACLTLPVYRRMRCTIRHWRKRLRLRHPGRLGHIVISCSHRLPLYGYIVMIFSAVVIPISTLVLLVSPQVAGGLARLRELQANNFQLPPEWVMRFQELRHSLADYPKVDKMISEFLSNLDAMLADTMGLLINRSVDVLGGTMTVLWTLFLFVTLTVIFAAYASRINLITARIFHIPATMLRRFVLAIRRALQGVMLGIVLVAIAQGVLCGIGFAVAGIKQPAFWGLLATVVAPIPFVGTALVWGPLCLSLWFSGATMPAVGLALWGTLAVTSVDNILRPLFLQQGINAPFFVLIIAILCGLGSFGPMGLIIGPVLLAIAMQAVEEAHQTYHHMA